jgi:hypothetical protein
MRSKGRTFSYIQEEIGVCHDVPRGRWPSADIPPPPSSRKYGPSAAQVFGVPAILLEFNHIAKQQRNI